MRGKLIELHASRKPARFSGRMHWTRAAEDNTSSHSGSGAVFFDIVHPEAMALSVGVGDVRTAQDLQLFQRGAVGQNGPT
jgi:hypothetical protein